MTREEYDWKMGRHSNIPDCCIDFFVGGGPWENENYRKAAIAFLNEIRGEYWPCITCLEKRSINKLHYCDGSCPKFKPDEYLC